MYVRYRICQWKKIERKRKWITESTELIINEAVRHQWHNLLLTVNHPGERHYMTTCTGYV